MKVKKIIVSCLFCFVCFLSLILPLKVYADSGLYSEEPANNGEVFLNGTSYFSNAPGVLSNWVFSSNTDMYIGIGASYYTDLQGKFDLSYFKNQDYQLVDSFTTTINFNSVYEDNSETRDYGFNKVYNLCSGIWNVNADLLNLKYYLQFYNGDFLGETETYHPLTNSIYAFDYNSIYLYYDNCHNNVNSYISYFIPKNCTVYTESVVSYVDKNNNYVSSTISKTYDLLSDNGEYVYFLTPLNNLNLNADTIIEYSNNKMIITCNNSVYDTLLNDVSFYEVYGKTENILPLESWFNNKLTDVKLEVGSFLLNGLNNFLSFEILPNFTLLALLSLCIAIPLLIAIIKMFLRG